jgi:adenylate kinase
MKKIIIFLGAPGSGKGTQAIKIAEKYGYGHISTGNLLRAIQKKPKLTADEKSALRAMKEGKLVPDAIIYHLAFTEMESFFKNNKGVVLDGAIRTLEQAKEYQNFFKEKGLEKEVLTIEVYIPDEESFNRLANRRVCESCGAIFPVDVTKPLPRCIQCGGKLVTRADDAPEIVTKRIVVQGNKAIAPIKAYFQAMHELQVIDGAQPIYAVEQAIDALLHKS